MIKRTISQISLLRIWLLIKRCIHLGVRVVNGVLRKLFNRSLCTHIVLAKFSLLTHSCVNRDDSCCWRWAAFTSLMILGQWYLTTFQSIQIDTHKDTYRPGIYNFDKDRWVKFTSAATSKRHFPARPTAAPWICVYTRIEATRILRSKEVSVFSHTWQYVWIYVASLLHAEFKGVCNYIPLNSLLQACTQAEFASAFAAQVHSSCASVTAVYLSFFVFGRVLTKLD